MFRRRCSSKRAVGDESASIAGGTTSELGRSICKCAWRAEGAQNELGTRPQEAWRLRRTFVGTSQGDMRPRTPSGILFKQVTAVQNDLPARSQRAKGRGVQFVVRRGSDQFENEAW